MPPLELVLPVLGYVVAPALIVSAFVLALCLWVFGNRRADSAVIAAFLAGCLVANLVRDPLLPWLPEQLGWQCLLWVASFALLIGLVARTTSVSPLAQSLLRALTAGHAAWLLVPAGMRTDSTWVVPVFALVVFSQWEVLERLANKLPGGTVSLAAALAFLGAAAVLIHAHSARMTDIATFIAAVLGGIAVVAWWARSEVGAVMSAAATILPGLLLAGYYETFSQVPWWSFALVGMAPLALIFLLALPSARLSEKVNQALLIGLLLAPVAVGVGLAMHAEPLQFE